VLTSGIFKQVDFCRKTMTIVTAPPPHFSKRKQNISFYSCEGTSVAILVVN